MLFTLNFGLDTGANFNRNDPDLSATRMPSIQRAKMVLHTSVLNGVQGAQFTGFEWTQALKEAGVKISMDGKGRFMDNIFIERLWRSLKYECIYLHAWESGSEARAGIGKWLEFYNRRRPHSAHKGLTPHAAYWKNRQETQTDQMRQRVA